MIYCFNQGIGWASSGIEYAQAYRATLLRNLGEPVKFIFTNEFYRDNIQQLTSNIGFHDEEVIWLYQFFTDCKIAPCSFTLADLEKTFGDIAFSSQVKDGLVVYKLEGGKRLRKAYLAKGSKDIVQRVELIDGDHLIRRDYYSYCRVWSEFFAPADGKSALFLQRFYNEDGSVAYDIIIDKTDDSAKSQVIYKFPDKVLYSKDELVMLLFERLACTKDDIILIDRNKQFGQAILQSVGDAKIGVVIHADHFIERKFDEANILWNKFYEYAFDMAKHVDFFIVATPVQKDLLQKQLKGFCKHEATVFDIPAGSLSEIHRPNAPRKSHSVITASRLAAEKHIDWLIEAVVLAREEVPDLSLDIYGAGGQKEALKKLIASHNAQGFIRLMGQHNLDEVYQNYECYVSASTGEGFGLTLMEAIGSGLPVIGFDVRYGIQTFVENERNGFIVENGSNASCTERAESLKRGIVRLFTQANWEDFSEVSYKIASRYTTQEVQRKWKETLAAIRRGECKHV